MEYQNGVREWRRKCDAQGYKVAELECENAKIIEEFLH